MPNTPARFSVQPLPSVGESWPSKPSANTDIASGATSAVASCAESESGSKLARPQPATRNNSARPLTRSLYAGRRALAGPRRGRVTQAQAEVHFGVPAAGRDVVGDAVAVAVDERCRARRVVQRLDVVR